MRSGSCWSFQNLTSWPRTFPQAPPRAQSGAEWLKSLPAKLKGSQPGAAKAACDFMKLGQRYRQSALALATGYMRQHSALFLESKLALERQPVTSLAQLCSSLSAAQALPPTVRYSGVSRVYRGPTPAKC